MQIVHCRHPCEIEQALAHRRGIDVIGHPVKQQMQ